MFGLSPGKLLLIVLILLLIFGASRLADIGKGLGQGIKNFKKGIQGDDPDDPKELKPKGKKKSDD